MTRGGRGRGRRSLLSLRENSKLVVVCGSSDVSSTVRQILRARCAGPATFPSTVPDSPRQDSVLVGPPMTPSTPDREQRASRGAADASGGAQRRPLGARPPRGPRAARPPSHVRQYTSARRYPIGGYGAIAVAPSSVVAPPPRRATRRLRSPGARLASRRRRAQPSTPREATSAARPPARSCARAQAARSRGTRAG